MEPSFDQIVAARSRIASGILTTPCRESSALSELTGYRVFTKLEYLQRTGSFKERGARNALLQLSSEQRQRGVVAASAGNHALALSYHGRDLGIPVTVVMPIFSPLVKQSRCRGYGARVELSGQNIGEAKELADEFVEKEGLTYVHGFDSAEVIVGQGTIGLEIMEQVPDADAVLIPIGGAGLIAGVGLAMKTMRPGIEIIGVEPENAATYTAAMKHGGPVLCGMKPSLADGLSVPTVGERAFGIAQKVVDSVVQVDEESIALSILRLLELEKGVVEGGGASSLAAILANKVPHLIGKTVVLILCGGNIDPAILGRVIEYGLVADGRLARFRTVISDRPGGLAKLAAVLAESGASVKQIIHDRAFASADVSTVEVECTVETRDLAHLNSVKEMLTQRGMVCK